MTTDNKLIGSKIKQHRTNKRFTQKELANLIGKKSEVTIRKYESGDIQVPNDVLQSIATALGVSVINLMDLTEQEDAIHKNNALTNFLESIGYNIRFDGEVLEWHYEDVVENEKVIGRTQIPYNETFTVTINKDKTTVTFTEAEYEDFKNSIEKAIEFEIFKVNKN
jgi:transcriptional regulator with XRE-family HTH domain